MHKIILVLDGQIDIEGGSGGWLVIPNHMIFVPANRPFNLRASQGTCAHVAFLSPEDYPWHHHGCWVTQANPLAHEYLAFMLNLSASECPDAGSLRQMFRTLSHMCREWFSHPKVLWLPAAKSEEMRAFVRYVSEDLAGATVSAACEACHMAQRTMQRMSHDEFSFGLKTLITEIRMMRAMELLVEDGLSVEAVAMSAGYSRLSSFTTAFTKRTGLSPSEFRQKNLSALRASRAAAG